MTEALEQSETRTQLLGCVNNLLDEREREIITLRYGLYGSIPLPQREVARVCKISRSYVSRIEKKALETLRHEFEKG